GAGLAALGDSELDSAFAEASPERDAMIDADGIAFEAMRAARLDGPEQVRRAADAVDPTRDPDPSAAHDAAGFAADSPFHTRSMAELLERPGDPQTARAIRPPPEAPGGAPR